MGTEDACLGINREFEDEYNNTSWYLVTSSAKLTAGRKAKPFSHTKKSSAVDFAVMQKNCKYIYQ